MRSKHVTSPDVSFAPGSVTVGTEGGATVVEVVGELDLASDEVLLDGLTQGLVLADDLLVVDLTDCTFVDSRSFRAIADAANFLHARSARMVVLEPPPSFRLIDDVLGDGCSFRVLHARHSPVA